MRLHFVVVGFWWCFSFNAEDGDLFVLPLYKKENVVQLLFLSIFSLLLLAGVPHELIKETFQGRHYKTLLKFMQP